MYAKPIPQSHAVATPCTSLDFHGSESPLRWRGNGFGMGFNRLKNFVTNVTGYGALIASLRGAIYATDHRFTDKS